MQTRRKLIRFHLQNLAKTERFTEIPFHYKLIDEITLFDDDYVRYLCALQNNVAIHAMPFLTFDQTVEYLQIWPERRVDAVSTYSPHRFGNKIKKDNPYFTYEQKVRFNGDRFLVSEDMPTKAIFELFAEGKYSTQLLTMCFKRVTGVEWAKISAKYGINILPDLVRSDSCWYEIMTENRNHYMMCELLSL